jgi:hypothetical protein
MPWIFRYFWFLGVAVNLINWAVTARRAGASGAPEALVERAQEIIRVFFGGGALWSLLVGTLQLVGGHDSPLFFLRMSPPDRYAVAVWVLNYALWGALLRGIWSGDAVEVLVQLRMIQNPFGLETRSLKLFYSGLLLAGAILLPLVAFALPRFPGSP